MNKSLAAAAASIAIIAGSLIASPTIAEAASSTPKSGSYLPACAEEDSINCFWDASARGNGKGRSFVDIGGNTYYIKIGVKSTVSVK